MHGEVDDTFHIYPPGHMWICDDIKEANVIIASLPSNYYTNGFC
jgi:hypothetical protein